MKITAQELFEKLKAIKSDNPLCSYTLQRCERLSPLINEVQDLKKKKNAIVLAHSYVHPDIIYGVADFCGDSYGLARQAKSAHADVIVFPAVRFMAETAKILNPDTTVIDPNPHGGCSLADSIDIETLQRLKKKYPSHTFVCYINTTAAIKAACDVCVTSSNCYEIIEKIANDKIYFLPDKLMGQNIKDHLKDKGIDKELLFYEGSCYVHEQFEQSQIELLRRQYPDLKVLAHPECKSAVVQSADSVCSTSGMLDYVKNRQDSAPLLLLTECGIASRLQVEYPGLKLVGSCMLCKYMKSNHLEALLQALKNPLPSQIVSIAPEVQEGALRCIEAMFQYTQVNSKVGLNRKKTG